MIWVPFLKSKKNYHYCIGFVYNPSEYMYSFAGLNDKISKAKVNKVPVNKIFEALNV